MGDHVDGRRWKVGELAAATGVTVRTLHYFDEIGVLCPAARSAADHRLYTEDDVRRLSRILALRDLEIPLGEIAGLLAGEADAGAFERLVRDRLDEVERTFESRQRLRRRLVALLAAARGTPEPSIDELIEAMEAMMQASYFTPDQLARLKERHREAGPAGSRAGSGNGPRSWRSCGRTLIGVRTWPSRRYRRPPAGGQL